MSSQQSKINIHVMYLSRRSSNLIPDERLNKLSFSVEISFLWIMEFDYLEFYLFWRSCWLVQFAAFPWTLEDKSRPSWKWHLVTILKNFPLKA